MKKILLLFLLASQIVFAQAPMGFKYQSVVRDGNSNLMVNKIISLKTSILEGSSSGNAVYVETQTLSTNDYGVVSLNIGQGTLVSGSFANINWGANAYFVKTELDAAGGSSFQFMGTSQILSVPYALYAEKSGSSYTDHDTSKTNELQTLTVLPGNNLSISQGNTVALPPDADSDTTNEIQTLSLNGNTLSISKGNTLTITSAVDLDADPTNELQVLSIGNDTIYLSQGNYVVLPKDNDRDSINEIQNLSISGKVISISKSNSISLLDNDSTNEIQSLTLNQGTLKISKANTVNLPDSSATNELQTLTINQGTLGITNGNTITLPDSSATNELQTLAITKDTLNLTKGNSVYLNSTQSLQFPEGTVGEVLLLTDTFPQTIYTIPIDKNLYVTYDYTSGQSIYNVSSNRPYTCNHGLPVIPGGTAILRGNNNLASGVLVNKNINIQIIDTLLSTTTSYTVPVGKTLYIKSFFNQYFRINGILPGSVLPNEQMLIVPAGTILTESQSGTRRMTGYLR